MASIKLSDMIPALSRGDYQLPDFQRELVWKSWQMEDLLVSILQGFFSGTLLLLQVNPTKPPFAL
ncbi:MAG: DUF262 domain-containing protein, partial [Meiothermus sp.]|uniref:DUF262 domain-containing protein n=1 Tax=Meiothermus sp. TaxID=1955249 RepID=UPI00345DDE57|nr:DUF262 domain-containing protein [Meiothermus sp.]